MNDKQQTRNFTPSDDALIKEQPVTRIGLKTLATMLRASQETSCVGLTNSAFRWLSVMIMRALSTHEPSVAATDSSTRY
ncbi:MAG: hypothetical protein WBE93_24885 [Pseudolabrys sp.]